MQRKLWLWALLGLLTYSGCTISNVENAPEIKAYFDSVGVKGCFALYDNNRGEFVINNRDRYLQRFPAGSTFDIATALIGLQTGALFNAKTQLGGQTLAEAFRSDTAGYFRQLTVRIGPDNFRRWMDSLAYGNKRLDSPTISPDEQLGLVKRMFFNQLSFQKTTQEVVVSAMKQENTPLYSLAYVAGSAPGDSASEGWVVGWVEESVHPYFFVLNIEKNTKGEDLSALSAVLLRKILASQGFFKGVK